MKHLNKLKKQFVINTNYIKNSKFNEPIYIQNADRESVTVYSVDRKNKIILNKIKLENEYKEKTFISIKDFFKKCTLDNSEYKIEKVDNGDKYIRVAYFNDLTLFVKINEKENKFIFTNINKYKFYKTNKTLNDVLNSLNYFNYYGKLRMQSYLKNLKNLKRDYIFSLNKKLEFLQSTLQNQ